MCGSAGGARAPRDGEKMPPVPLSRAGQSPGSLGLTGSAGLQLKAPKKYGLHKPVQRAAGGPTVFAAVREAWGEMGEGGEREGRGEGERKQAHLTLVSRSGASANEAAKPSRKAVGPLGSACTSCPSRQIDVRDRWLCTHVDRWTMSWMSSRRPSAWPR